MKQSLEHLFCYLIVNTASSTSFLATLLTFVCLMCCEYCRRLHAWLCV